MRGTRGTQGPEAPRLPCGRTNKNAARLSLLSRGGVGAGEAASLGSKRGFGRFVLEERLLGARNAHSLLYPLPQLVAAIVFISFGVVAAFCCAVVDGVFAARHIVSSFYILFSIAGGGLKTSTKTKFHFAEFSSLTFLVPFSTCLSFSGFSSFPAKLSCTSAHPCTSVYMHGQEDTHVHTHTVTCIQFTCTRSTLTHLCVSHAYGAYTHSRACTSVHTHMRILAHAHSSACTRTR